MHIGGFSYFGFEDFVKMHSYIRYKTLISWKNGPKS